MGGQPQMGTAPNAGPAQFRKPSDWRESDVDAAAGAITGRFRARTSPDNGAEGRAQVTAAVKAVKAGDEEALRFLYLRYSDNVYGYLVSIVRDEHEAEDLTQHVFLKLMRVIHKYEPREVPFAAWIMRVARNMAVDHLRSRRQIPCEEVYGAEDCADVSHHERRRCLTEALATLPEEQREVLVLRHLMGLSPGEIAERMGKTDASVHGLHHRARQAAQVELERLQVAPTTV
jgi:RNA polymerase sigma-70 factor, ECF subfamily